MAGGESGGGGRTGQLGVDQRLDGLVEMDVLQGTAAHADEMMVVVDERLGQLEVGVVGGAGDSADHPAPLENLEIAVRRALGQIVGMVGELGEGYGTSNPGQRFDEVPATAGVAVVMTLQPPGHGSVEIVDRGFIGARMPPARRRATGRAGWRTHRISIS